jgi:adenylate cyclase class 2
MSADATTETEIKLYVPDLETVAARLETAGATISKPRVFERNVRYEDAGGTFASRGVVLRMRQDDRARLTYKEPPAVPGDDDILSRFEAEVTVSDFDMMDLILSRLGFRPYMTYEKYRTTYALDSLEIVLDEMPYGPFVEIEGEADAIRGAVERLELGAAQRMRANYTQLFDNVRRNLNLAFTDLTFANFEGVAVAAAAFEPTG